MKTTVPMFRLLITTGHHSLLEVEGERLKPYRLVTLAGEVLGEYATRAEAVGVFRNADMRRIQGGATCSLCGFEWDFCPCDRPIDYEVIGKPDSGL